MTKINNSGQLIDTIKNSIKNMSFDEYSNATGISKEYLFRILKGEIEEVDENIMQKLRLQQNV